MSFSDFDLKADQFFREKIALSPMVGMFLSLPYQSNDEAETRLFPHTYDLSALEGMEERNLLVEGGEIHEQDDHGRPRVRALFTPSGVLTRKMLLCFFAKWYQDPDYVFEFDRSTDARYYNQLASTFGYQNQKARQGKRYVEPLMQLIAARFTFLYHDTIEKA